MTTYNIKTLHDWDHIAHKLLLQAGNLHTWCLHGHLGAGKTTLVKALGKHLGIVQPITSPTYTIMQHYDGTQQKIHHIDLYRINNIQRIIDIGLETFLYTQDYVFIEWPSMIKTLLKYPYFDVHISLVESLHRIIKTNVVTPNN